MAPPRSVMPAPQPPVAELRRPASSTPASAPPAAPNAAWAWLSMQTSRPGADADGPGAEAVAAAPRFWAAWQAVRLTERARQNADEAVAMLVRQQGPRIKDLQAQIATIEQQIADSEAEHVIVGGRTQAIRALKGQIDDIVKSYDPSQFGSCPVPPPLPFLGLPYAVRDAPMFGPLTELQAREQAYARNARYAPEMYPQQGGRFGKYGGADTGNPALRSDAVRSSVNDAYAYDIETNMVQVANDIERLARSGVTEIHIATGTHGDAVGGLFPENAFLRQDARSIMYTSQNHPGLRIVPYNMADRVQVAQFEAMQALAAEGRLPGGATIAAYCFSCTRVPDPDAAPIAPFGAVETLDRSGGWAGPAFHGGASMAFGALGIYGGLQDPNRTVGGLKVASGGSQVVGGASYLYGHASDSLGWVRFGSRLGEVGGYAGSALALVDFYRGLQTKFEPGVQPLQGEEAVYAGIDETLKLAGAFYLPAAALALGLEYGVKPGAEKASEYLTPKFIGAMSQAYGMPEQYLWGMH